MKIYTMGFKGKSQEEFIKTINKKKIELVVDRKKQISDVGILQRRRTEKMFEGKM